MCEWVVWQIQITKKLFEQTGGGAFLGYIRAASVLIEFTNE